MSDVGHCGDNAPAEGFFGMLKRERVNRRRYRTVADARADVFDYIERFHNPRIERRLDSPDRGVSTLTQPSAETG
jgi:putative transposase